MASLEEELLRITHSCNHSTICCFFSLLLEALSILIPWLTSSLSGYIQTMKLGTQGLPIYRQFTVAELEEATSNFSQSTYMGKNSFGKVHVKILNCKTVFL